MSVDEKLTQIDDRLSEIETEIRRLTELKRKLSLAKEKLKDQKYLAERTKLQQNDWRDGKPDECCIVEVLIIINIIF